MPPISGLFLMKTKPYFEAADKSSSGALGLDGEMSMTGMFAFDKSILMSKDGLSPLQWQDVVGYLGNCSG